MRSVVKAFGVAAAVAAAGMMVSEVAAQSRPLSTARAYGHAARRRLRR